MESPKMSFPSRCKNRTDQYGPANYPFHAAPYRADIGNLRNLGSTYRHGTVFAPKQCLYMKRKLWVWRAQKCNFLVGARTVPTSTDLQTTPFMLRRIGSIMKTGGHLVLPIAMVPCLHQSNVYIKKKVTGMESLKI